VDKNPVAVELTKLSLWLVTMDKRRPFTFMDGSLRHGDSLVGLSLDQLRAFHWQPSRQLELDAQIIGQELDEAIALRHRLIELALSENGVNPDPREKNLLWRDFEDAIGRLRLLGDVCLGAFFAAESDRAREQERVRRLELVRRWFGERDLARAEGMERNLRALQAELRQTQVPFHWMIEFPDVFWDKRADPLDRANENSAAYIDSFVGNPPFMGVAFITEQLGEGYVAWLQTLHPGTIGKFDLSAQFFRRTASLLGDHGTIGLISTNTIGQGDTRATGLQQLTKSGFDIYDATPDMPWPTGEAAVTVSIVHLARGRVCNGLAPQFTGVPCAHINSSLRIGLERDDPSKLATNESAAFVGSYVLGMGFTLTPEERAKLITKDRRNAARTFPYLGGEEVNTSPTQDFHRYVINFGDMPLDEANAWPDLLAIVREKVKPEREKCKRDAYRTRWWRFAEPQNRMREAIAPLERCLVTARVTKHLCFSFQPVDRVFSEGVNVIPIEHYSAFATLQSRVHEPWARRPQVSSMKMDIRYSASDCFETFPFPNTDPRAQIPALEQAGKALYEARAKHMLDTDQGLTKTYNALKDPSNHDRAIEHLRKLHEAMDRAVLDAYGWQDLTVPPFCPKDTTEQAQLKRFEAEVIDRLYALNAERAAEEERLGISKSSKRKVPRAENTNADKDEAKPARPSLKPPRNTRQSQRTPPSSAQRKKRSTTH
jgi:hypothetical protein